jgi:hypothetical protein
LEKYSSFLLAQLAVLICIPMKPIFIAEVRQLLRSVCVSADRISQAWQGDKVQNHKRKADRPRRDFLKAAGGAVAVLAGSSRLHGNEVAAKADVGKSTRPHDPADRGLWVTWYDLREEDRDAYLSWLHGTYLPEMLKRPGYLWAAHYATQDIEGGATSTRYHRVQDPEVPTGFRYILLIGASDANVFGNPVPSMLHAALPDLGRRMLAMRVGERVNLMAEAGRCEGSALKAYKQGPIGAPCIQIGSFNCPLEYEEEMHGGYVQVRLPAVCATSSCIRTRKLNSVVGWAKHGILYEFASLEGFSRDYAPAVAKSPLGLEGHSIVPMLTHAPNGPNSAVRIWPPA